MLAAFSFRRFTRHHLWFYAKIRKFCIICKLLYIYFIMLGLYIFFFFVCVCVCVCLALEW